MYHTIPSIREKDGFVIDLTHSIFDPGVHHQRHR